MSKLQGDQLTLFAGDEERIQQQVIAERTRLVTRFADIYVRTVQISLAEYYEIMSSALQGQGVSVQQR